jgi:uncharacterized protein (DUF2141 family)
MRKLLGEGLVALLAASAVPASASVLGSDAAACGRGDSSVLVRVDGFKARSGVLRVQVYGSNPADFLAKGKKLRRVDVPVTRSGRMDVCVAVPGPGQYAIAVRHDVDGNGKSGWNDGGGFSRNPSLSLVSLKPKLRDVVISVGSGVKAIDVTLNYRQGLSIGPVNS